ncbi:flagellar hook-length control protein FliK [Vibrio sp. H11]|uniref:flagellar hook-length control protein FliK n=1 Tax=Vibrio sp. H11 TaxID=2565928 RepID=UPI0010A5CE58|nr:flagellar hook-length control protein FliK [Vibrio sp. H11]
MNVNSTSSAVDNSKATNVVKSAGQQVQQDESGENSGFLSKLSALLFGASDQSESSDVKKAAGQSQAALVSTQDKLSAQDKLSTQDQQSAADGKLISVDSGQDAAEGLLEQGDGDEQTPSAKGQPAETQPDIPKNLQRFIADESDSKQGVNATSQQVMSDGDALIGRLKDANQALAASNGNILPPFPAQPASRGHSEDDLSLRAASESVQVVRPMSAKGVLSSAITGNAQLTAPGTPLSAAQGAEITQLLAEQLTRLGLDDQMSTEELQELTPQQAAAILAALKAESAQPASADPELSSANKSGEVKIQSAAADSQSLAQLAQGVMHDKGDATPGVVAVTADSARLANSRAESQVSADNAPHLTAVAQGVAAAAGSELASAQTTLGSSEQADKIKSGVHHNPAGAAQQLINQWQTAQQQSTQQAGASTHNVPVQDATNSATVTTNAANPAGVNPALNPAMLAQTESLSPAALKAALAGSGIGKLTNSKTGQPGQDSAFASQVATAAGQQGMNATSSNLRAEPTQAQPQMPLHLSKEMDVDDMAQRVQMMMSKNLKQIDIRLDPPELGRLHIRMNMHGDGASVQFTVANNQARDALEHSMPRLREMLSQQGVQLGDTSVQQQNSGQQQRYAAGGGGQSGHSSANERFAGEENLDTDVKLDLNVAAKRDGISYYA